MLDGAINPDTFKARIQDDANGRVASTHTHDEGRMLANRTRDNMLKRDGSSIVLARR